MSDGQRFASLGTYPSRRASLGGVASHVEAEDARPDRTSGRIKPSNSEIVVDLPGTVRPEVAEHLARLDLEVEVVQGRSRPSAW